jgi:hypothetical protein
LIPPDFQHVHSANRISAGEIYTRCVEVVDLTANRVAGSEKLRSGEFFGYCPETV